MKYSLVIVTYNRRELLEECVASALNQTMPFHEVIIVDNHSTDRTREYLSNVHSMGRTRVRKIQSNRNMGGAGGFSIGLKNVGSDMDYVLLIDDDAILYPDFLEQIDQNRIEGVEAYSGTVEVDGEIDILHRRRINNMILMLDQGVPVDEYRQAGFYYQRASFCGLMISVELLRKIGYPRTDFFIQFDDTEYSHRIIQYSPLYNVNGARINHKTKVVKNAKLTWKNYYLYRNQWYVGLMYSERPEIYNFYRWLFHHGKYIILTLRLLRHPLDYRYYMNLIIMQREVLKNVRKRELGMNRKYQWGIDLN